MRGVGGWEREQWRVLVAALSGVFISLFPFLMVVAALPTIAEDLGSESTLAWALTAPLLASAVLLPTLGRLGDLYGHRRVFVVGLSVSGAFALLSALAWNPLSLVVFRTISQSAGTATSPAAIALVISAFSQEDRPRVLGYWAFAASFAPGMGLLAGGPAVDAFGWRGLFLLQAALVVVVLPLAFTSLKESIRTSGVTFDIAGGAAFMAASGSLVFALDRAGRWHWGHPAVVVAFLVVPVALVVFLRAERRAVDPILPVELLRHGDFVSSCACELLIQISTNGGLFLMSLVFTQHYDAGVGRIALYLAPMPLGMALLAPRGGRLAQQLGERTCAVVGCVALAVAFAVMLVADESRVLWLVLVAWFVVGLANGLIRPGIASAAAAALDPAYYGAGMATTRMVSTVGAAAGITLVISLLPAGGTGLAMGMCVVASALAGVAGWYLRP
ncbi:MAG: Major Facilitator Superfamily transporter, partial [Actinomycetia bacterium]|nr:Major Facilitator Superfamily transporter [Actinomycetes bacterium]